ncbi:MAG: hypothetical protein ACXWVT_07240 [Burkholderiaceae bacterium]
MPVRCAIALAGVVIAFGTGARPSAQAPAVKDVLERTAAYVERFQHQLSQIVAEETYAQTVVNTSRLTDTLLLQPSRTLRSDLILVRSAEVDRFVELRDVFEVDGKPVRDRQARLERFLGANSTAAGSQIAAIIQESARYNVGTIRRNVNTPLLALMFLQDNYQDRFTFKHLTKETPVFKESRDREFNDAAVFRVSTEMWTIEYRERKNATVIRTPTGGNLPARGRFWIDPSTGAVLISEMIVDGAGVIATVTVSYQSEPLMGLLVPIEMRESYLRYGERITGHAVYGKFRVLKQ